MEEFGTIYNLTKIYNNFEVSKLDNINIKLKSNDTLQVFKIINSEFDLDEIYKPCI